MLLEKLKRGKFNKKCLKMNIIGNEYGRWMQGVYKSLYVEIRNAQFGIFYSSTAFLLVVPLNQ